MAKKFENLYREIDEQKHIIDRLKSRLQETNAQVETLKGLWDRADTKLGPSFYRFVDPGSVKGPVLYLCHACRGRWTAPSLDKAANFPLENHEDDCVWGAFRTALEKNDGV